MEGLFRIEKLNKAPAVFDYQKLDWFNGQYIRQKSDADLASLVKPFLVGAGMRKADEAKADELDRSAMPLVRERLRVLSDAPAMMAYLYARPSMPAPAEFIPKKLDRVAAMTMLREDASLVTSVDLSDLPVAEERFRARSIEIGAKLGDLLMPLRVAVTGSRVSPPLFESMRLLGTTECLARIEAAIVYLGGIAE
jgi:glutamyl-tRNA synthetase